MNNAKNIKESLKKPIVLIGMMGSGKSRLGHALAHALEVEFYDSDAIVEERAGRSIPDIFEEFGEAKFRQAEQNTILELLDTGLCVIGTGGGAITSPETLAAIKAQGVSVWLQADMTTILSRVLENENRPLLQHDDPEKVLNDLMEKRVPLYEQADIQFDTSAGNPQMLVRQLIKTLCEHLGLG